MNMNEFYVDFPHQLERESSTSTILYTLSICHLSFYVPTSHAFLSTFIPPFVCLIFHNLTVLPFHSLFTAFIIRHSCGNEKYFKTHFSNQFPIFLRICLFLIRDFNGKLHLSGLIDIKAGNFPEKVVWTLY